MKATVLAVIVCVMGAVDFASADNIRGIDIDFVTIGNVGNAADGTTGYGAVDYDYRIGKYEITNAQWNTFTVAAGAPTGNPSNAYDQGAYFAGAQQPTNNVSWYEAAQFCNYLTSGDKSLGAYQLGTDGSITVDRDSAISAYGKAYVIPTENEWYKAAYYTGSGYSLYANGQNTIPTADNGWNYSGGSYSEPWNVGTGTQEQNGTFDMMGNVWEWTETLSESWAHSRIRGDSYGGGSYYMRSSSRHNGFNTEYENIAVGFRVASVPEPPEPATIDIDPDTLSLSSKDKWVACYIELPSGYEVMDIDGASVKLEGISAYIGAEGWAKAGANSGNIMDHDGDGILERMVKFDGAAVRGYLIGLGVSGYTGLTVTGDLVDGPSFEGIDVIKVIK